MKLKLVFLYVYTVLSCNKNVKIFTYSRVIACFYLKIDVCQRLEVSADLRTKCQSFQPPFSQQQNTNNFTPPTVVIIATAQLHSTQPKLWFCLDSNLACSVSEIRDDKDLEQLPRLEIRLNVFCRSATPTHTHPHPHTQIHQLKKRD